MCSLEQLIDLYSSKSQQQQQQSSIEQTLNKQSNKNVAIHLPLIYSVNYDVHFFGFERLHPFDTHKWTRVMKSLLNALTNTNKWIKDIKEHDEIYSCIQWFEPTHPITDQELAIVHTPQFLIDSNNSKRTLVATSEVCLLYFLPISVPQRYLLRPLRYQTTGTILASLIALKHQVAINVGGGFHHCSAKSSGGFCFFADITLAIRTVWDQCLFRKAPLANILLVDCDAHQGNGYARDVLEMSSEEKKHIYILDLYNPRIYPRDEYAKASINREVLLPVRVKDQTYLELLDYHLNAIMEVDHFRPDFVIFNAGTDILRGDPLGQLSISPQGIVRRDEMLFEFAHQNNIPILMLLSGGYQRNNAAVIANSILNLLNADLIKPINIIHT